MANIILIGMPGAGKSTIGVLLAKASSRAFVDTDLVVQASEGRRLQAIIDQFGIEKFLEIEERCVMKLRPENAVIATGGSVIYREPAMMHLKKIGDVVFLNVSVNTLKKRLANSADRGIVAGRGQTLEMLFRERLTLYEKYADKTFNCEEMSHDQIVAGIETICADMV
jgi:shikimate kinase